MHVAVNALYVRPGVVGGGEVYVRELLTELAKTERITLFCWAGAAESLAKIPGIEVRPTFGGGYSHLRRLAAEARSLPAAIRSSSADVVLGTGNHAVAAGPLAVPQVVTVHDLQHLWYPRYFSAAQRAYRSAMLRHTIRVSARLIAISEFTKADIEQRYGVDPARIATVPLGTRTPVLPTHDELSAALARYQLTQPFFYYPAALSPHKNHDVLYRALRQVRERGCNATLVLTGAGDYVPPNGAGHSVRHLGLVPRADVWTLLTAATALVFPSRFEGFGLPLVEAMHCGTPVIASNCGSIPEVVDRAGLLLDPDDPTRWAEAMIRTVNDPELRTRLRDESARNLGRFSWAQCARKTRDVLLGAIEGPGSRRGA